MAENATYECTSKRYKCISIAKYSILALDASYLGSFIAAIA